MAYKETDQQDRRGIGITEAVGNVVLVFVNNSGEWQKRSLTLCLGGSDEYVSCVLPHGKRDVGPYLPYDSI